MSDAEFEDDVTVDVDEALLAQIRAEAARRASGTRDDTGSGDTGEGQEGADEAAQDVEEEVLESVRFAGHDDVPTVEGYGALREIGSGGFSRVYEGLQFEFQRWVAIKVLNQTLEGGEEIGEFERECRLMGVLSRHPNIVTVFASAFTSDHRPCIVMELFPHGSYSNILQRTGPLALEDLLPLAVRISGALATAHRQGMVHGDVKPQNIFQSEFGTAALGDFGIATLIHQRMVESKTRLSLYYAAPELIDSGIAATSPFADQYSLGATIYTLATGLRPFQADARDTTEQLLSRMLSEPPPHLGGAFPASLNDALRQAMAREPQDRHRDMVAFAAAIANVQQELGLKPTEIPMTRDAGRYVGQTPGSDRPRSTTGSGAQDSSTAPSRTGDTAPAVASGVTGLVSRTVFRPMATADVGSPTSEPETPPRRPRVPLWAKIVSAAAVALGALAVAWFTTRGSDAPAPAPAATTTSSLAVTVPDAPRDLVVQGRDGRLVASWDEPDDGGSDITAYRVELYRDGAKLRDQELSSDDRNAEFPELVNGVTYDVRVVAVNSSGDSDPARAPGTPTADVTVPEAPRDLVVQGRDGRLVASWDEPDDGGSSIVGYRAELFFEGTKIDEQDMSSGDRFVEFPEIAYGGTNETWVVAVNSFGDSDPAVAFIFVPPTVPEKPDDLVVQGREGRLVASWGEPDSRGSAITAYRIELYHDGTKLDEQQLSPDDRDAEFSELVSEVTYEVRVVALNGVGESDAARASGTPPTGITVPEMPSNVDAHGHYGRLEVTWDEPSDGGSPITGYRIEWHSEGTKLGEQAVPPADQSLELSNLPSGQEIAAYVWAENVAGSSEPAVAVGMTLHRIAFVAKTLSGQSDIYYADFSIGDPSPTIERVTETLFHEGSPTWSPDGSWIAFHRSRIENTSGHWQIWIHNVESGVEKQLVCGYDNGGSPHWSVDGRHIIFSRGSEGKDHLYWIDVVTGEVTDLKLGNTSSRRPKISPDKNHVAFMRGEHPSRSVRILHIHSASRNVDTVLPSDGADQRADVTEDYASPDWLLLSDHNEIAFSFSRSDSKSRHIYSVEWSVSNPRGNDPEFVIFNGEQHTEGEYNDDQPSWSPDGRWIAFTRRQVDASDGSDRSEIFVASAESRREPIPVVKNSLFGFSAPSWAPELTGTSSVTPEFACSE